jgi:hypothetical protein
MSFFDLSDASSESTSDSVTSFLSDDFSFDAQHDAGYLNLPNKPAEGVFAFEITKQDFETLVSSVPMHRENIIKIIFEPVQDCGVCTLAIKGQHSNAVTSNTAAVVYAKCSQQNCYKYVFKVRRLMSNEEKTTVNCIRSGVFQHHLIRANQIRGKEREAVAEQICNTNAEQVRLERTAIVDKLAVLSGNRQQSATLDVLHKIASEHRSSYDLHQNDFIDIVLQRNLEMIHEKKSFIKLVEMPLKVVFFHDDQTTAYYANKVSITEPSVAHFDSTGSVVKNVPGKKPFYYALVVNCYGQILPLLEFVLKNQYAYNITHCLSTWKHEIESLSLPWPPFTAVVTDFSYAMLQAATQAFNKMDLLQYLSCVHRIILNHLKFTDTGLVMLKLCVSHLIKGWKVYIFKCTFVNEIDHSKKAKKAVRSQAVKIVCNLIVQTDLSGFIDTLKLLMVIFLYKFNTKKVLAAKQKLLMMKTTDVIDDASGDTQHERVLTKGAKSLRAASPMFQLCKPVWEKIKKRAAVLNRSTKCTDKNILFSPQVVKYLMNYYVHVAPLWSAIAHSNANLKLLTYSNANVENFMSTRKKLLKKKSDKPARVIRKFSELNKNIVNLLNLKIQMPHMRASKRKRVPPKYLPFRH